jgi:hypothetical protein
MPISKTFDFEIVIVFCILKKISVFAYSGGPKSREYFSADTDFEHNGRSK